MTTSVETRVGIDTKRIKENYKRAQKEVRDEQVKMFHREAAWKYVIKKNLSPILSNLNLDQTYLNSDLSEFNIQILLNQKLEIWAYIELLEYAGFRHYCYAEKKDDEGNPKDPWEINRDSIRQVFYPNDKLMDYIQNRFGDVGGRIYFRINFDFYPIDGSECKIVHLGTKTVSYEKSVIELECDNSTEEE